MKQFMNPEMEIVEFKVQDVITTSGYTGAGGENETGGGSRV